MYRFTLIDQRKASALLESLYERSMKLIKENNGSKVFEGKCFVKKEQGQDFLHLSKSMKTIYARIKHKGRQFVDIPLTVCSDPDSDYLYTGSVKTDRFDAHASIGKVNAVGSQKIHAKLTVAKKPMPAP
ncbi:MAG: hypothetical protein OEZ01_17440 [Candidatus Heimdallarchaeota archaeon]|nr:hypothetical protein [Candidatus Heimdallarchaeota archaeon]